jgi:serine/threonine-protein kinase
MALDPARWAELKDRFAEVSALAGEARAAALRRLDADPELRDELAALLTAADSMGDRFEHGPLPPEDAGMTIRPGQRIGSWAVLRELGHGGMGTVYEAERVDDAFTKRVALKTVSAGHDGTTIIRRFRHERQILARLEHPNIAALLDGGVTAWGAPYFVMEFVDGAPIDRWCAERSLDLRGRLSLFLQVCGAVQYAHERLIVHRDLKPANILVGADGTAKLLDFGIAKLLQSSEGTETPLTQTGVLPMTTAYASPEQLRGEPVTVASDIYSLGVVLYELLAGRRPFDDAVWSTALRATTGQSAAPPSRAVRDTTITSVGRLDARRLRRMLSGELDAIVLQALRPEPGRRYQSVTRLMDDVQRYLDGRPVRAQPDTAGYRVRKFVRRNRVAVTAGLIAVTALAGATILSLHQAAVARAERDVARREQRRTEQVTQFFRDVLTTAKPQEEGRDITVVEAMDRVIPRIDTTFRNEPDLRAAIKSTLGSTLADMYLYDRARPLAEDALRLRRQLDGNRPSREQADALYNLAGIESESGSPVRAESLYQASLAMYRRLPGVDSSEIWRGVNNMAGAVSAQGRFADAITLYEDAMRHLADTLARDTVLHAVLLGNIGTAMSQLGRYRDAEPRLAEAVALLEAKLGHESPRVASLLQPLAGTRFFLGQTAEAETAARESWAINRRTLGDDSPGTIVSLRMLVNILADAGRCGEALPLARRIVALRHRTLAELDPSLGTALLYEGWCEAELGDPVRGEAKVREGLALRRAAFGDEHWAVWAARSMLGDVLAREPGREAEADAELSAGYEGLRATLDSGHVRVLQARERLRRFRER